MNMTSRKAAQTQKHQARLINHPDGSQSVEIAGLGEIPVLGVLNCSDKPLPAARETAKRIEEYFTHPPSSKDYGGTRRRKDA